MIFNMPYQLFLYWIFTILFAHLAIAWLLSIHAARTIGKQAFWLFMFIFVPVVSHVMFIFALLLHQQGEKEEELRYSMEELEKRSKWLDDKENNQEVQPDDVTPFADSVTVQAEDEEQTHTILNVIRDDKIDELIEFELYIKALELAEQKLLESTTVLDSKSARMYRAYIEMLTARRENDKKPDVAVPSDTESSDDAPDSDSVNVTPF